MPIYRQFALMLLVALAACPVSGAFAQATKGAIDLEVLLGPGVSPIEAQKWGAMLEGIPVENLSIRSGNSGETEKLDNYGTAENPRYKIKALLTDRGELMIPGGTFRFNEKGKLVEFLSTLREKGDGAIFDKPKMFGLGSKDLVDTYKVLQVTLTAETKDRPSKEVILEILKKAGCKSTASADAKKAIQVEQPVLDELKGLSAGTALASVLRPLGLVFYPSMGKDKSLVINIVDVRETKEPWPIGWPLNKAPSAAMPKYREQINVAFDQTAFRDVMGAISERLGAPILFDHNSMVRNRFDPETDLVTMPEEKLSYARILEKTFAPRRLGYEVRMDEAGAPFVWVNSKGRPKVVDEEDAKPILGSGKEDR